MKQLLLVTVPGPGQAGMHWSQSIPVVWLSFPNEHRHVLMEALNSAHQSKTMCYVQFFLLDTVYITERL